MQPAAVIFAWAYLALAYVLFARGLIYSYTHHSESRGSFWPYASSRLLAVLAVAQVHSAPSSATPLPLPTPSCPRAFARTPHPQRSHARPRPHPPPALAPFQLMLTGVHSLKKNPITAALVSLSIVPAWLAQKRFSQLYLPRLATLPLLSSAGADESIKRVEAEFVSRRASRLSQAAEAQASHRRGTQKCDANDEHGAHSTPSLHNHIAQPRAPRDEHGSAKHRKRRRRRVGVPRCAPASAHDSTRWPAAPRPRQTPSRCDRRTTRAPR